MAGLAPQGSQYDARHYDSKIIEVLGAKGQDFFTSYDEVYDSFDAMGLKENLLRGFEKPSPIQQRGILPLCEGFDVIQQAQQGTGKTATFCSGILQQLDYDLVECQALILTPTRELAQQIGFSSRIYWCPGRVFDMLRRQSLCSDNIKMFVLDEADEMLSRGLTDQMYDIFQLLPAKIQVRVFSATMLPEALEITRKVAITQSVIFVNTRRKVDRLTDKMQSHDHTLSATHGYMIKTEGTLSCRTFALVPLVCSLLLTSWHVVLMSSKSHLLSIMISRHSQRTASIELTVVDGLGGRVLLSTLSPRMMKECFLDIQKFYHVVIEELASNVADLL
ncbi:dead box ATP-dependent RNA helicase, putative [Ricinus communis]|uniref:ATP-dependent RNA helicase n=1 Tax=Ricinus communis TaxID=3988 RepID=B9RQS3_RICCO|nr:dead box ATP-dependent RNA helicase, putative [Ricinus communis]